MIMTKGDDISLVKFRYASPNDLIGTIFEQVRIIPKNGHEMMRRFQKCVRTHGMRSNVDAVARRAEDERSPVSPRLTEPALAVICG
jgi:hypothetical protein